MPRVLRPSPTLLSVIAGAVCLAVTVPRPGLCPLGWIALIPLFVAASRARSYSEAARYGVAFGFVLYATMLYWIYSTCRFAHLSIFVGALALSLMSLALSSNWVLVALAIRGLRKGMPAWAAPWVVAAACAAVEFCCGKILPELEIFSLSYAQWRYPAWIQGISWTGPLGLTFLIALVNAALAETVLAPRLKERNAALRRLAVPAALAAAWWGCGARVLSAAPPLPQAGGGNAERTLMAAIVQPDIDQYAKWNAAFAQAIRENIGELTAQARALHPDLILWPESSVPGWLDEPENWNWVMGLVAAKPSPPPQPDMPGWGGVRGPFFVVGSITRDGRNAHNSAVAITPDARIAGMYNKRRLVPFGEYVPLRFLDRWISILTEMGDMDPGAKRQKLFNTPFGKTGAEVCYEGMFPYLTREPAAAGARVIVNITNDGWYKDTWGPYQLFYANRFRAIENRVYILRAANTGISGGFDPWGRTLAYQRTMTRAMITVSVPEKDPFPGRSFYTRTGDWFGWLCFSATIAGLVSAFFLAASGVKR